MSAIRKQVEAAIIGVMAEAEANGTNGVTAARHAFPGTPEMILWECWAEFEMSRVEAWWQTIERTIDGEVIRSAIAGPASESVPAGPRDAELDASLEALFSTGECR